MERIGNTMCKAKLLIHRARGLTSPNLGQGLGWRNMTAKRAVAKSKAKSKKAQLDKTRWLAGSLVTGLSHTSTEPALRRLGRRREQPLSGSVVAALLRLLATDLNRTE